MKNRLENVLSFILIFGLILSIVVVIIGGSIVIWEKGTETPSYTIFHGEPIFLRELHKILTSSFAFEAQGLMQLGIVFLIFTPMARVVACFIIFLFQKDVLYSFISLTVLGILIYSFFGIQGLFKG